MIKAILSSSVALYGITEFVSALGNISSKSVTFSWAALTLAGIMVLIWYRKTINWNFLAPKHPGIFGIATLLWLFLLYLFLGIIVFTTPPYNWDSMTYHLPRIFQWMQNNSIAHFATENTRQIHLTPFAEYVGLHFYLLAKDDFGFNLVQYAFSIGFLIMVYQIAKDHHLDEKGQWIAVLFASTMPMLVLQSSSTQNDLVAAFFYLCSYFFVKKSIENFSIENAVFLGLSVSLAVLTKGTNYIFLVPLAVWLTVACLRSWRKMKPIRNAVIIIGILFIINIGYWSRNYDVFKHPFAGDGYFVEQPTFRTAISGLVKNSAQNLMLTQSYFNAEITQAKALNKYLRESVTKWHSKFNEEVDHDIKNWPGTLWWRLRYHHSMISEDFQSNPIQGLFFLLTLIFVLHPKFRKQAGWWIPLVMALIGFLLLSALLKWQPWHNRQIMGLLALGGIAFSQVLCKKKILPWALAAILIAYALNPLLNHGKRSFFASHRNYIFGNSEKELVFAARKPLLDSFLKLEKAISSEQAGIVALELKYDDWEYPFWYYLHSENRTFMHINPNNKSAILRSEYIPDLIVSSRRKADSFLHENKSFVLAETSELANLYVAKPATNK